MRVCGASRWRDPNSNRGTPRTSVVDQTLSNSADSPATWRFIDPCDYQLNDRKLRSLLADLGTRKRASAQWRRPERRRMGGQGRVVHRSPEFRGCNVAGRTTGGRPDRLGGGRAGRTRDRPPLITRGVLQLELNAPRRERSPSESATSAENPLAGGSSAIRRQAAFAGRDVQMKVSPQVAIAV
jgi:hypothetical protein